MVVIPGRIWNQGGLGLGTWEVEDLGGCGTWEVVDCLHHCLRRDPRPLGSRPGCWTE